MIIRTSAASVTRAGRRSQGIFGFSTWTVALKFPNFCPSFFPLHFINPWSTLSERSYC